MNQTCQTCNRIFNPDQCSPKCPHLTYSLINARTGTTLAAIDALPRPKGTDRSLTLTQGEIMAGGFAIDHVISGINAGTLTFPNSNELIARLDTLIAKLAANIDTGGIQ
jgi:hypothetical protein